MTATLRYELAALRLQVHDLLRLISLPTIAVKEQSAGDAFRGNPPFGDGPPKQVHGFDAWSEIEKSYHDLFRHWESYGKPSPLASAGMLLKGREDARRQIAAATRDIEQRKRISGRIAWIQES